MQKMSTCIKTGRRSIANCLRSSGWSFNSFSRADISVTFPFESSCFPELPAGDFLIMGPFINMLEMIGREIVPCGNGGRSSFARFTISNIYTLEQIIRIISYLQKWNRTGNIKALNNGALGQVRV